MCTAMAPELVNSISHGSISWIDGSGKRTQLDDESDSAHYAKTDADSLAQLKKFLLVG